MDFSALIETEFIRGVEAYRDGFSETSHLSPDFIVPLVVLSSLTTPAPKLVLVPQTTREKAQ